MCRFATIAGLLSTSTGEPSQFMLQVAIASPNDLAALDDLRFATGCQIQTFVARASESALMAAARANHLTTLREQCLVQVREGLTTLEEVVRVTQ